MKKALSLIICVLFSASLVGQEKYPIPVMTSDQKHGRTMSQVWVIAAAGMNFAKTRGISPYEYGKILGSQFAPSWGPGNDFEGFVKGSIFNFESFRHVSDPAIYVAENSDGSVTVLTPDIMWHKYFPDGNPFAAYNEFLDFSKGLFEPIADHMGARIEMTVKDPSVIYTFRRK